MQLTLTSGALSASSIFTCSGGGPVISYIDITNSDLKVACCDNALCSSATLSTIDSAGDVGWYTSIAIGADVMRAPFHYNRKVVYAAY